MFMAILDVVLLSSELFVAEFNNIDMNNLRLLIVITEGGSILQSYSLL